MDRFLIKLSVGYPDEDVELYYHILFGVKVDPTAKEEEKVYELILKYF